MSRELDEACARALGGWPEHDWCETWDGDLCLQCWKAKWEDVPERCEGWTPSLDLFSARLLEDEIERRGLQDRYVRALLVAVIPESMQWDITDTSDSGGHVDRESLFALIRATPEQRARAFLEAVQG